MKVAIIGAGLSGLTAGIYALKQGYEVEIYEKNANVGGMCVGWTRKGTNIDGCLHWLTESDRGGLHDIWVETGALGDGAEIYHGEMFYRVHAYGEVLNFYLDSKKLEKELLRFAEGKSDVKKIK